MRKMSRLVRLELGLLAVGLLVVPTGCLYRAKVKDDSFEMPNKFARGKGKAAARKKAIGRFWRGFKNPELDRLMTLAFKESLEIKAASARIYRARAQLQAGTAGFFPTIGGKADLSRSQNIFNFGDFGTREIRQTQFSLSLQASYEVDLWGKVRHGRKAAKYNLVASHEDLRASYISLAAGIADAYYGIVQQRALIKLLDKTIENRESQLKLVQARYKSGVSRADDLYQSLQSVAAVKAQREAAIGALKLGQHVLAQLVGRYPGQVDPGKLDKLPPALEEFSVGQPGQLLLQRPDLRAGLARLKAVDQRVGAAFAAYFPSLTLGGSLGYQIEPATGFIWNLLGGLTAPIFQGGRIDAAYKESKAVLKEQIVLFQAALQRAVKEVEDALVNGRAIAKRIKWLEERVEAANGAVRLSLDQYSQGLTLFLNVLTAEQALLQARTDLINARRELIAARITLARALGGKWMDKDIKAAAQKEKATPKTKKVGAK
jgi:multidrug efflux system outer membrane protein